MNDKIEHPPHYNHGDYECWDVMYDLYGAKGILSQVLKYIWRQDHKDHQLQDLKKAQEYLNFVINKLENQRQKSDWELTQGLHDEMKADRNRYGTVAAMQAAAHLKANNPYNIQAKDGHLSDEDRATLKKALEDRIS